MFQEGRGTKASAFLDCNAFKIRRFRKDSVSPPTALVAVKDETDLSLGASFKSESEQPNELHKRKKESLNGFTGPSLNNKRAYRSRTPERRKIIPSTATCQNVHTRGESSKLRTPELSDEEEEILRTHTAENQEVGLDGKSLKSVNNNSANKKKEITLAERIMVMDYAEKFSERETASAFGISKSAVNAIKKNKREIMSLYEASKQTGTARCRRIRRTCSKDVNDKTWKWFFQRYRRKDVPTNKELQEKALEYARASGVTNFSASKGWLDTFKKRYGITLCRSVASIKNISSIHAYLKVKKSVDAAATGTTTDTISPSPMHRHMKRKPKRTAQKLCDKL